MPPPSPLLTVALLAVAAIAAAQLHAVHRLARAARDRPMFAPLAWYGIGVVLGPVAGLLDQRLLLAATPALVLAGGWVAARAGTVAAAGRVPSRRGRAPEVADALASWLLPAVALYAAMRWLPGALAPAWQPQLAIIAILAAGIAIAASADRRVSLLVVISVMLVALVVPLPSGRVWRLPRQAVWAGGVLAGTIFTIGLWGWVLRRVAVSLRGIVVGLALGAGMGLASAASPFVVCATAAAELTRRSKQRHDLRESLVRSEAPATAMLWVAAGALLGGLPLTVAVTALALSIWPLLRRLATGAAPVVDLTVGLALVFGYVWTAGPTDPRPLITAVAMALLVCGLVPAARTARPSPLTSGLARVEVSV